MEPAACTAHHLFFSSQAMTGKLVRSSNDGLKYMADLRSGRIDEKMDHLVRGILRCGAGKDGVCVYACFVCVRILLCVHVRVRRYCVCVRVCACVQFRSLTLHTSHHYLCCVVGVLFWRDVCPDKPTHGGQQ